MSEQARIAFLQQRIKEAQNRARISTIGLLISTALFGIFMSLYSSRGNWNYLIAGICFVIAMIGAYFDARNANRIQNELTRELYSMSVKIPTCPRCGKQIPQGNFTFCPFCASPLTRSPSS